MFNHTQTYRAIRNHMQAGDVIAFGGESPFSKLIKFSTRSSVSHVAVVFQSKMLGDDSNRFLNQIIESTSYNGKSGVMINRLSDRIATYPGHIWWLPLSDIARAKMDSNITAFFNFLLQQEHKEYDMPQALMSAVDHNNPQSWLGQLTTNEEDFSRFFCSELVAAALEKAQVISQVNASEVTPIDLCRFNLYKDSYTQLKGDVRKINGFNQLDPLGWGQ